MLRLIFSPIGVAMGIRATSGYKPEANLILEKAFLSVTRNPDHKRLEGLSKQLDWSVRRVERWFRRRRNQERPSPLKKFTENSWRCAFYSFVFLYGIHYLPQEDWFWTSKGCWINFPYHALTPPLFNYYLLEWSFYISLLMSVFTDVRRKDFIANVVHHIATVMLIFFSYICNFTRIGSLVMVIHDVSDIFLEGAKITNYAGFVIVAHILFVIFTVVFFVTRVLLFPYWILGSIIIDSHTLIGAYPSKYFFMALLCVLYILHLYWFSIILSMVYCGLKNGKLENDSRSDVAEDTNTESSGDDKLARKNGAKTNSAQGNCVANHH
ncbi:ceramide synthase 6-like isoform X2 [Acanthaster planci]|uniref:Ceramide synthase 6-like isoform X2 n=1 Tax=Acanthaster planci TaxID=133434 RepID=A0A8B7XJ49_ACAPL|nr:ceramide synthase 6-like isoform X2 [Acanthaster planci]